MHYCSICRPLEFELVPVAPEAKLVICNTMLKHKHSGGEYNRRREECEAGVRITFLSISGNQGFEGRYPRAIIVVRQCHATNDLQTLPSR